MAIVDYLYYTSTYCGKLATECDFAAYEARSEDVIGAMTRWQVTEDTIASFPAHVQTLYKKAVCAQADYFSINGFDALVGGSSGGFTVGRVSINGGGSAAGGRTSDCVSPLAAMYLEQTGLLAPQVDTAPDMPNGWWDHC